MRRLARTTIIGALAAITLLFGGLMVAHAADGSEAARVVQAASTVPSDLPSPSPAHGETTHCHPDIKAGPGDGWGFALTPSTRSQPMPARVVASGIDLSPAAPPPRHLR